MAEKQPVQAKRLVKNPETFRERAVKASEAGDTPSRGSRIRSAIGKVFSFIFGPVIRTFGRIFALKPFRIIGRILRPVGRVLFPTYFRKSWQELKQVTWPDWKQSRQLTFAVIVFATIFGVAIAAVDYGLDKVFKNVLLK